MTWVRVASAADLAARGRLRVAADGHDILLVRAGGAIHACGNVCAHQHFAMLHAGTIDGCAVTCPMHGWSYDVRTGAALTGEGRIPVYPVSVEGDDVSVGVP